jgi:hypothetical protein
MVQTEGLSMRKKRRRSRSSREVVRGKKKKKTECNAQESLACLPPANLMHYP